MLINRLLVANRGEIALRVIRTCRRLGIRTVAVYSDADAGLPYVAEADWVIRLPGNTPAETYLDGAAIISGAQRMQVDAIHPGYGFLSENADFARAVEAAGITWVGPTPESMEAMGSKIEAKAAMKSAGVPVLEDDGTFPVLVKASAGGGGRGMRIVRDAADLDDEIEMARAEAKAAFGDDTVFVEPYVEHGRHIEVQVLGDPALGIVHVLGERDCSVQRRHQKVIEEAPAPGLTDQQRDALHDAARDAAAAIGYRGAGTVEFLVDASDPSRFWFLEMNTRLQVEHPVTEEVTGIDLVELQLAVAEGRGLDTLVPRYSTAEGRGGLAGRVDPRDEGRIETTGHAIEVRLYAEDPANDWQPQSGRLATFEIPHDATFDTPARAGIRLDAGFTSGSEVSTYYDAMLAKVISWAPTREQAIRQLVAALRKARIHGVSTNRDLLIATLTDPAFVAGDVSTAFFDASGAPTATDPARRRTADLRSDGRGRPGRRRASYRPIRHPARVPQRA